MEKYYHDSAAYAGEPASVAGMKRCHEPSGDKLDAAVMEKRYMRHNDIADPEHLRWKRVAVYAPSAGTKRGYEQPEDEMEAESVHKRYKGNYWEDPACARAVQLFGGRKAQHAAQTNQYYRYMKEVDEWLASLAAV